MVGAFQLLKQLRRAVVGQTGSKAHGLRVDPERRSLPGGDPRGEPAAKHLVDDLLERLPALASLRLQLSGHVFIEGQGRTHIMMLTMRHHDVKRPHPTLP